VPAIIINMMTAVHASSSGMSIAFPDVCKTPIPPAGPVPIPYPNIAMSSDAASEAKKVKFEGAKVMVKSSNFKMSSGDEAGSAQGLVSSKIKGKAEFANYSFDVKIGGENACRLADPMKQNIGSPNAFGPAELQAPNMAMGPQQEACDRVNESKEEQDSSKDSNWKSSGVHSDHRSPIQTVVTDYKIVLSMRATNPACGKWIGDKHRPKPHAVVDGKTINASNEWRVRRWLRRAWVRKRNGETLRGEVNYVFNIVKLTWRTLSRFHGIVMVLNSGDQNDGMPMIATQRRGGLKGLDTGISYKDKWITGDYDLMDIMFDKDGCDRPGQRSKVFLRIRKEMNNGMGWDGIQHGPQAQWVAKSEESGGHDFSDFSIPTLLDAWVKSPAGTPPPKVQIASDRMMPAVDNNLTIVYPGGVVVAESNEDVKDAMICMGCAK
jgi:hypothetical protein